MILGIGTDLVQISRIEEMLKTFGSSFENKVFTDLEQKKAASLPQNKRASFYAKRFAAKEAFSKALGTGIVGFSVKDVYIQNDEKGKPLLIIENKAKEILEKLYGQCKIHITMSHEKEYAVAFVIIENNL